VRVLNGILGLFNISSLLIRLLSTNSMLDSLGKYCKWRAGCPYIISYGVAFIVVWNVVFVKTIQS